MRIADLRAVPVSFPVPAAGPARLRDRVHVGLKIDEKFIAEHPLIEGPCYV